MRISRPQITRAKGLVRHYFGDDAELRLFGSRTDDAKRGGDYDFFVETSLDDAEQIAVRRLALMAALQATPEFEDERVDVVVKRRSSSLDLPIYTCALAEGLRL